MLSGDKPSPGFAIENEAPSMGVLRYIELQRSAKKDLFVALIDDEVLLSFEETRAGNSQIQS